MRLDRRAFGSKVALKVFGSFVLAAVIPVIATIVLVQTRVVSTLTYEAQRRLDDSSRTLGTALLDRLTFASDSVIDLALGSFVAENSMFEAVQLISDDGISTSLGEPFSIDAIVTRVDDDDRARLIVRNAGDSQEILIARSFDGGIAVGRIKPNLLWDAAAMLPYGTELCVFDQNIRVFLRCADSLSTSARNAMISAVDNKLPSTVWTDGDGEIMASHWTLFLPSRFAGTQPWGIVVSQPKAIALEPVSGFNRLFPQVIAICLVITLLLSAIRIRQIMQPLRQLVAGTKRVAEQEFSTRLDTEERNEFSELAQSFNEMTERLGNQFETITAFAEIDRLILSSQSLDQVMEKVLDRVIALTPDYCVSVLIIDPDQQDRAQLFSRLPGEGLRTIVARISITDEASNWMASVSAGGKVDPAWIRKHIEALPVHSNAQTAVVVPVFRGDLLRGALIAQLPEREQMPNREYARLLDLTSRLAVAISAADHESELFNRAHFDQLTGLPNRQLCFDRLYQAIAQARREEHQLAVLFIDLDGFKNINDSFGHTYGDELLKEVALRLNATVRETDTVARLGGDEFVVVLPHIHGMLEVEATAEKIYQVVSRPYGIRDQECTISASIGATVFPDDAADADELLRKADTAMYSAKDHGRSQVSFFEDEMDRIVKERVEMQQDLREALANKDFRLVYQPQLDIETGQLICMEALIRWHHPSRGMVPPGTFIPVLEDMGLISDVGKWVIETAFSDFTRWAEQGLQMSRIAVNVSSQQITAKGFESELTGAMQRWSMNGEQVEVELTEHSLIENFDAANRVLNNLKNHGVRVAIDDFGTGYSSLSYLHDLNFDVLKIDRGFVNSLPTEKSVAIVEAIVSVASALGKEVVAEGIDAEVKRQKLVELGCRVGQGFLFSVPIAADDVIEWSRHLDQTSVIQKLVAQEEARIAS